MNNNWVERDLAVIWHPDTQMQTEPPPIPMVSGKNALLTDAEGNEYIDAISSWWVSIHGHGNTYIAQKIGEQAAILEHCIFAGFTHPQAVLLAERLLKILPAGQSKVFYSDNGSTTVEVALKMAIQYWHNRGIQKHKFIAFKRAYHGDTFGAMSVSGRGVFTHVFEDYLFEVDFIDLPDEHNLQQLTDHIAASADDTAAFIFEPLILGAGGMLMYEPAALDALIRACRKHDILIIADEVMTGFGRTGKRFAMEYLESVPDIICLSKGLTGGTMALGVTSCTKEIYDAFLSDDKLKALFHGHSFTANPIGCTAALASMDLFLSQEYEDHIQRITDAHKAFRERIAHHPRIKNLRQTGTVVAFEVITPESDTYTNSIRDQLYSFFLERRIMMRPLGNTVYILPPYTITNEQLEKIYTAIEELLAADYFQVG